MFILNFINNLKVSLKILLIVAILSCVAIVIACVGYSGIKSFEEASNNIYNASTRAYFGEQVNAKVYAIVMDSRGIYMSPDTATVKEKFHKPLLANIEDMKKIIAEWDKLIPEEDRAGFDVLKQNAESFAEYRTELARLGAEVSPVDARAYGDNDQNRANRKALNAEIEKFTLINNEDIEQELNDIEALKSRLLVVMVSVSVIGVVIGVALSIFISKYSIIKPVQNSMEILAALQSKQFNVVVQGTERQDEFGQMARALDGCRSSLYEASRAEELQEQQRRAQLERATKVENLARDFDKGVSDVLMTVSDALKLLENTSNDMSGMAGDTKERAVIVSNAASDASSSVESAAAAIEELTASINEISRQMSEANVIVNEASQKSGEANSRISYLAEAANKIGEVVNLINDIAEQTNLLALNATIEAARAGDAGKGFAVVASEVKTLAAQTSQATEDIRKQINAVQGATSEAVGAVSAISKTIQSIDAISATIAAAVEEQGAATQEINRNVSQTADGTIQVSRNIDAVSNAAQNTHAAAQTVMKSISALKTQSGNLRLLVSDFIAGVKSA